MKNIALLITAGILLVGCSRENTEPKVETSVSVDYDKDKLNNALDKAGKDIEQGAEKAKDKLEDAGDAIKRNVEEAKDKLTDDKKAEVKVEIKD